MDKARAEQAIAESSWRELLGWAAALTEDQRTQARRWYRSSLRAAARRARTRWDSPSRVVQVGLAIALSERPEEASRNCMWAREFVAEDRPGAYPQLSALLVARGRQWACEFAEHAVSTVVRGDLTRSAAEIAAIVAPVYSLFGAEIPRGSFPLGWAQLVGFAYTPIWSTRSAPRAPLRLPRVDESGCARFAYDIPTSLLEVLRATPRLREVLSAALQTPDALADWSTLEGRGWNVADSVAQLIEEGVLERESLIDDTLAALARADRPSAQKVTVAILRGAGFGAADGRKRRALVSHLMPTVHGSVTAALLPAVLGGEPDDDFLLDVGSVILARPEKAQKNELVAHLSRNCGTAAAARLLAMAAEDRDGALAAKARKAMADSGAAQAQHRPAAGYPWALDVQGRQVGALEPWPADPGGLDSARSDQQTWVRITSNALWLDLVTRYGCRDLTELRDLVRSGPELPPWLSSRVASLLYRWCSGGGASRSDTLAPGYLRFTDRLVEETLLRLGKIPELLSTPSHWDGTLTVDDLLTRLRNSKRWGVAPYDLVQALLRLEPASQVDAARFAEVSVEARSSRVFNAGDVVRSWLVAGGLPNRRVEIVNGLVHIAGVDLPLPPELSSLDGLADLCAPLTLLDKWSQPSPTVGGIADYLGVVPQWADTAAALLEFMEGVETVASVDGLALLAAAPGSLGVGAHRLLALLQSHPRPDARLHLVESLVEFARQGRLDSELLRGQTLRYFSEGRLSLTRLAHTWEHAFRAGLMRWLWPSAMAVLGDALRLEPSPAGVADLIRAIAPAMPTARLHWDVGELPGGLRQLAGSKSRTKAAAEARVLVAAAEGGNP